MILNPQTLHEIRTLEEFVKRRNGSHQPLTAQHSLERVFEEDANFHSAQLELPVFQLYGPRTKAVKKREIKKATKATLERLKRAWAWAKGSYNGVSQDFIQGIAARIDPSLEQAEGKAKYRARSINVSGSAYTRTNPEKIAREIGEVLEVVGRGELHPVEAAALLHFHVLRVHPFEDGNGRTSRVLQNVYLVRNDLPPALIERGERELYNRLVEEAVGGHRMRTALSRGRISEEEQRFYEFVGSKVLIGLERIARQKYSQKH